MSGRPSPYRVGLTGGIACGKSTVARELARRGALVVDADRVGHRLLLRGAAGHAPVVEAFGPGVVGEDGEIDRERLGAIVFSDAERRERLNALLHPLILGAIDEQVRSEWPATGLPFVVVEAALLVESGLAAGFDALVVVHCTVDEQLRRLVELRGLTAEAARARLASQTTHEVRLAQADHTIDTGGTESATRAAASALFDRLRADAEAVGR